jgi:uncharacterized CHY-type Zn-finger protein
MNNLRLPPEVLAIQNWLIPEFYRISLSDQENNIYIINALREQDDDIFELNIEYNCEHNTAFLTIHCLKEVNCKKYYFCIELVNYLNFHNTEVNFSLNPRTMILSCSQTIGFADWEANSEQLTYRLYIYTSCSLDDLTKISHVLEENIGIVEAVHRTIGDVPVFVEPE